MSFSILKITLILLFSTSAWAKTLKVEAPVIVGIEEYKINLLANKVKTSNPEVVRLEHLRINFEDTKLPLLYTYPYGPWAWCKIFGYKYSNYSMIGNYDQDYLNSKVGLVLNEKRQLEILEPGENDLALPFNYIQCTDNKEFEY